jgi:hypothetical protein
MTVQYRMPLKKARDGLFSSAKTIMPVVANREITRELLIQASLDPSVLAIEPVSTVSVGGAEVDFGGFTFLGDDGRRVVEFDDGTLRDLDGDGLHLLAIEQLGLPVLRLTADDVMREPRAGNCRAAWFCRNRRIAIGDRIFALASLREEGPMRLLDLTRKFRYSRDPLGSVLALACADVVALDLESAPLGPQTRVWLRRSPVRSGG